MSYKIFLSYSGQEVNLAAYLRNALNKVFKSKVEIFFDDIKGGEKWKDSILSALHDSDAILTILSPAYLKKPWAYIEWAAFWLQDKTTYVVVTDDVEVKDIVEPIKDVQFTRLFSEPDIVKLLEAIAEKADVDYISYTGITEIVAKAKAIYGNILFEYERKEFSIYKNDLAILPNDDFKKSTIFWFFYEKEADKVVCKSIFSSMHDNAVKGNILLRLLEKNDIELIENTFEFVDVKSNLLPLLKGMMEHSRENAGLIEKVVEYVSPSQSTLRAFGEYLIQNGWIDDNVFAMIIPLFSNKAELRRLAERMLENEKLLHRMFDVVVQQFYGQNHAELQKLLKHVIEHRNYEQTEIKEQICKLAAFNQREAEKVLTELIKKDVQLVKHLLYDLKIITAAESMKRLEDLLSNL